MAGVGGIAGRLYRGEVSINFVRRQRMWYTISGLILLISVVALLVKGLDFSVDFKGGSTFQFPISATAGSGSAVQGEISRVERRTDIYISTLSQYVRALGGKLEIRAIFPDSEIRITQFEDK